MTLDDGFWLLIYHSFVSTFIYNSWSPSGSIILLFIAKLVGIAIGGSNRHAEMHQCHFCELAGDTVLQSKCQ